jgi:hypothetical protein
MVANMFCIGFFFNCERTSPRSYWILIQIARCPLTPMLILGVDPEQVIWTDGVPEVVVLVLRRHVHIAALKSDMFR